MKWIKCSDEMPPDGVEVLIWDNETGLPGIGICVINPDDSRKWLKKFRHEYCPYLKPTYWCDYMPDLLKKMKLDDVVKSKRISYKETMELIKNELD